MNTVNRLTIASAIAVALLVVSVHSQTAPRPGTPGAPARSERKAGAADQQTKPATKQADRAPAPKDVFTSGTFTGLELRSIGPAVTSGRVLDIAVDPTRKATWYVATVGGVWKTTTAGTSWTPVFDGEKSFSIGCLTIDPHDPLTVWVGTGENNSQRSVSYGDGVYKSIDGGKSWENVGLKESMHIGKIAVDPRDSKAVYVAAMGPLWSPGGDRGLYKTNDGGKSWTQVLKVSENTGVSDVVLDPRNPDVLYAGAYQRRRHVWTLIGGGPESALYKSTDAGATWKKLENGLPKEDIGRIGLAISPANPEVVYAVIEAANQAGGFFRSKDRGANWQKMSGYTPAGMYYQEIFADPKVVDRVYSMDVFMQVTEDGGKTFHNAGEKWKHVDNHALWIDPDDPDHLVNGNDGGVYESWDRAASWAFKANLPVTQFYRVAVDNSMPFYYVYGGTQDNASLGGPSRTIIENGISNDQWFVTTGGDGFVSRIDPNDANIVYAESQHGGLVRFDRRTGEQIDIQPQSGAKDPALRWNWDSPLMISPHSPARLYFAAQRLFRSDDRGNSWKAVSPDLTRQIDRNKLKVMGRVWSVDAMAKNASTSFYGNIVSLSESPVKEGLLYVGTDDGLVQVTEDSGATWRKIDTFPGVPEMSYISRLEPSPRDADTVYAAFDNHKMGDLKPYLLKSTDRGRTWTSIAGDLPSRGSVYVVVEDPGKPDLLFAGTEFGLFFTIDGGKKWVQLKGGLPTIAVRDIAIQKRENDLAVATFGRGFYILDDYTPLGRVTPALLDQEASLFPVRQAWMFIQSRPYDLRGKAFLGEAFYTAPNPPFGAVFTYYLKDELKSKRKARLDEEKKIQKEGGDIFYPAWDALRAEDREETPAIVLTVTDEAGSVMRRISGPTSAGFHRVSWDLRYPPAEPASLEVLSDDNPFSSPPQGPMVAPGSYKVSLAKRVDGKLIDLGPTEPFSAAPLGTSSLPDKDRAATLEFQKRTASLQRAVLGAVQVASDTQKQLALVKKAIDDTTKADATLMDEARALEQRLAGIQVALNGDATVRRRNEPTPPSIVERVQGVVYGDWTSTSGPTETHRQNYATAAAAFAPVLEQLRVLVEVDLKALADRLEAIGAPWTPGRVPRWAPDKR
jgi:photosystem II stability/assembly factor-like uncharacterized protein